MERMLVPGLYKHFKDKIYMVIGKTNPVGGYIDIVDDVLTIFIAKDSETGENISVYVDKNGQILAKDDGKQYVLYQAMYTYKEMYVREYNMFMSEVDKEKYPKAAQKYRFEKI